MKHVLTIVVLGLFAFRFTAPLAAEVANGDFESGDFSGWTADPNWVIAKDGCGYYAGWHGGSWAWSGGGGEPAVGKLRSNPFVLEKGKEMVHLLISGWNYVNNSGATRQWNYITLNRADGTEIDRVWAPNGTSFVHAYLDGSGHVGESVYIEAVDDASKPSFSMLCIDDVRTVSPDALGRPMPTLPAFDPEKSVKLEDDRYCVEIDRSNGAIQRIADKQGGLELILEPRLANNFWFSLPIPGKEPWQALEANYIRGTDQKLSSLQLDGKRLTLKFDKPMRNFLGQKAEVERFDVAATMTVELTADGVLFGLKVDNATPYQIGEVFFPILGGMQGLGGNGWQLPMTELVRPTSADGVATTDVFRQFNNMASFADEGPEQFFESPKDVRPWAELYAPRANRSARLAAQDPKQRPLVLRLELEPSSSSAREDGNWPRPNELNGLPVGLSASFVDFANAPAGQTYEAASVLVSFHDGDWRAASNNKQ